MLPSVVVMFTNYTHVIIIVNNSSNCTDLPCPRIDLWSGAPNNAFLLNALKICIWIAGVHLKALHIYALYMVGHTMASSAFLRI